MARLGLWSVGDTRRCGLSIVCNMREASGLGGIAPILGAISRRLQGPEMWGQRSTCYFDTIAGENNDPTDAMSGIIIHRGPKSMKPQPRSFSHDCFPSPDPKPLPPKGKTSVMLDFIPFIASSLSFFSSSAISFIHLSPFSRISFSNISYCFWPRSRTWSWNVLPCSNPSDRLCSMPSIPPPGALVPKTLPRKLTDRRGRLAFASAFSFWSLSLILDSRRANSVGMCVPSKDLRTSRVSRESKVAINSRNGMYETSSLS